MAKKKKGKGIVPKKSKSTVKSTAPEPKKAAAKKGTARVMSAREYEKLWKDNRSASSDFEDDELPEGIYTARLVSFSKGIAKQGKGDHYVSLRYLVTEGEHEGAKVGSYSSLATDIGGRIIGQVLSKLGYDQENISFGDLADVAKEITEAKTDVEIEIKHKDGYQNVYLKWAVE